MKLIASTIQTLLLVAGLLSSVMAVGNQTVSIPIDLGFASHYAVLAGSAVTSAGQSGTVIYGDVGVNPGTAIAGFPPATCIGTLDAGNAAASAAQGSLTTAYNEAAGRATTTILTNQDLGGMTLSPGVYTFNSIAELNGDLTLDALGDADAVWIFQFASALNIAQSSSVLFKDSVGNPEYVYWQMGSSATINHNCAVVGNFMALQAITVGNSASVVGRLLARNAAVTLDFNSVKLPANQTASGNETTSAPSLQATLAPTVAITRSPSVATTIAPSVTLTTAPTVTLSAEPSAATTPVPGTPTLAPSVTLTTAPTVTVSVSPSPGPTPIPGSPTIKPSVTATFKPSIAPSVAPSGSPTQLPGSPTRSPTIAQTASPSRNPSVAPSKQPTLFPSAHPTAQSTVRPSSSPTVRPSGPSAGPTAAPSAPSASPTIMATSRPTSPTLVFNSTVTITGVTILTLTANGQRAVANATASCMGIAARLVKYKHESATQVAERRALRGGSGMRVLDTFDILVYLQSIVELSSTAYANTEEMYAALAQKLSDAVESGEFTTTLRSNAVTFAAPELAAANATAVESNNLAPNSKSDSDDELSTGAIIGIVIGGVAFLVICAFLLYYCCCRTSSSVSQSG